MRRTGLPDVPPANSPEDSRMVARTESIEEANRIAEQYDMQGFTTKIVKRSQAGLSLYEVWVSKKPDIIS